jgi:outer membrane protein assembly factor BamB
MFGCRALWIALSCLSGCGRTALEDDAPSPIAEASTPAGAQRGGPWLQRGANAKRNSRTTATVAARPAIQWTADLQLATYPASPVADGDGNVYVAEARQVRSFDAHGAVRWTHPGSYELSSGPGAYIAMDGHGGLVVTQNDLQRLDASTGAVLLDVPGPNGLLGEPVIGEDGTIYFADFFYLYAYALDGTMLWSTILPASQGYADLAMGDDGTLVATAPNCSATGQNSPWLYKLDASGSLLWSVALASEGNCDQESGPAVADDGTIWLARVRLGPELFAWSASGAPLSSHDFEKLLYSTPALDALGRAYVAHLDGASAVQPDGTLLWTVASSYTEESPVLSADVTVIADAPGLAAAGPPTIRGLRAGSVLWTVATTVHDVASIPLSSIVSSDGTLYVLASRPDRLFALR